MVEGEVLAILEHHDLVDLDGEVRRNAEEKGEEVA